MSRHNPFLLYSAIALADDECRSHLINFLIIVHCTVLYDPLYKFYYPNQGRLAM